VELAVTHIKVCGLTRLEDVALCGELGVELLGFNAWPQSPRYVPREALIALVKHVSPSAEVVLVFVREKVETIAQILGSLDIPAARLSVQLHGDEDPRDYASLPARLIQVLRIAPGETPPRPITPRVLVDAHVSVFGGSGTRVGERDLDRVRDSLPAEWLLAGGLNADNVAGAIESARPWGVDVASGVEATPGGKDHARLRAFVKSVRDHDR
jgi:phosphoribosylanthranilate isomerase